MNEGVSSSILRTQLIVHPCPACLHKITPWMMRATAELAAPALAMSCCAALLSLLYPRLLCLLLLPLQLVLLLRRRLGWRGTCSRSSALS